MTPQAAATFWNSLCYPSLKPDDDTLSPHGLFAAMMSLPTWLCAVEECRPTNSPWMRVQREQNKKVATFLRELANALEGPSEKP